MSKYLFDASIYIPFIRTNQHQGLFQKSLKEGLLYYSSVVAEELYAGARDKKLIKLLDKLFYEFENVKRLVTPARHDWQQAGKILAKIGGKYGYDNIKLARLLNDTLIALSAQHIGATVVTENISDFKRIQEFKKFNLIGSSRFFVGNSG